jgi:flagellar biosynthetic protein FliQ
MENVALGLFHEALRTAVIILMPILGAVALVGVLIGIIQTIVQVQDQNVSFAPKIAVVAVLAVVAGPLALASLQRLFTDVVALLPRLANA